MCRAAGAGADPSPDNEESEATQFIKSHKCGCAGSVFGHCGPKETPWYLRLKDKDGDE